MHLIRLLAIVGALFTTTGLADEGQDRPINVGDRKRLTWDDSLFDKADGIRFEMHRPHRTGERNLIGDKPWESWQIGGMSSLLFENGKFRLWYGVSHGIRHGEEYAVAYAESDDGLQWTKPELGLVEYAGSKNNNLDLADLTGTPIRLRLTMRDCKLYAFQFAATASNLRKMTLRVPGVESSSPQSSSGLHAAGGSKTQPQAPANREVKAVEIVEYAPRTGTFSGPTHIAFHGSTEIVTAGSRLYVRADATSGFEEVGLAGLDDAHSTVHCPWDGLFYVANSGKHQLATLNDLHGDRWEGTADQIAGVPLERPHDVVCDGEAGWLYALNPNQPVVLRLKALGRDERSLDLSQELGYSRSLTVAGGKLFVVGSSAGKVIEIDDFEQGKYRVHVSFGKRRDAPAGSWKATGLVPNDAEFYRGYWYVTSYFCPTYAAGEDCDENKLIRFRTWADFETGNWQDLSRSLPGEIVPYYLTLHGGDLFLAAFNHEAERHPGKIYRITEFIPFLSSACLQQNQCG